MKKMVLSSIVLLGLLSCLVPLALADLTYSYTLARTSPADPINLGSTVLMTASTTNPYINAVTFKWYAPGNYPAGPVAFTDIDTTKDNGFNSSNIVNAPGEWKIVATYCRIEASNPSLLKPIFEGSLYSLDVNGSFFVVPESVLGTAMSIIAPLLAVACIAVVKRNKKQ